MTSPQRTKRSTFPAAQIGHPIPLALACCAFYALYFLRMGAYPLFDPDEPVYGQVAREMAHGAGWLTPHWNGAPWFDKPPLFYWLSAASVALFGPTEFACRLPSAIGAVALALLVYALARHDFGPRAAVLCALVMATCLQQIVLARAAVTDMTFAVFLTAALYGYRRWTDEAMDEATSEVAARERLQTRSRTHSRTYWALWCGAATGLAMLTKGPVAPVLLSITFVLHLWWMRRLSQLRGASAILAVTVALLVGLPWYGAMYYLHRQEFVQGFLVANNITRFLKAEHASQTGHWYSFFLNVPVLLGFFFPWSAFLPQALLRAWQHGRNSAASASTAPEPTAPEPTAPVSTAPASASTAGTGTRLALVWFGVVFVFFSLSKTQLVTYIFPLYPAAALLVGALWSEAEGDATARRGVRGGLYAALLLSVVLTVALVLTAHRKYVEAQAPALVVGAILGVMCGVALWLLSRRARDPADAARAEASGVGASRIDASRIDASRAAWALGAGMIALTLWLMLAVVPRVTAGESTRDLVVRLPAQAARVAAFKVRAPSLLFYLGLRPQDDYLGTLDREQARRAMQQSAPLFVLCRDKDQEEIMLPGVGEWARSGKLVVLGNAAAMALPLP